MEEPRDPAFAGRLSAVKQVMDAFLARFDPRDLPQTYPPENDWRDRIYNDLSRCVDETASSFAPGVDANAVLDHAANEAVALGLLEVYLDDDSVSDIYINAADCVVIERNGRLVLADDAYTSADFLYLTAQRLLSMQGYTPANAPSQSEVRFGDGTLVQVVLPPVAVGGPIITVRKPRRNFPTLDAMTGQGALSEDMSAFLRKCIEARRTVLIAGPRGSGRTSLVNALGELHPDGTRIIAVEKTSMLQLPQRTAVALETQPMSAYAPEIDAGTLVNNAVRMRPDLVIVDDITGREALGFLGATAAGAGGSIGVVSAFGAHDAVQRLAQLASTGEPGATENVFAQIGRGIDIIVVLHRFTDGSRRIVEISEVCGAGKNRLDLETIFTFRLEGMGQGGAGSGQFLASGSIPRFYQELEAGGVRLDTGIFRD